MKNKKEIIFLFLIFFVSGLANNLETWLSYSGFFYNEFVFRIGTVFDVYDNETEYNFKIYGDFKEIPTAFSNRSLKELTIPLENKIYTYIKDLPFYNDFKDNYLYLVIDIKNIGDKPSKREFCSPYSWSKSNFIFIDDKKQQYNDYLLTLEPNNFRGFLRGEQFLGPDVNTRFIFVFEKQHEYIPKYIDVYFFREKLGTIKYEEIMKNFN